MPSRLAIPLAFGHGLMTCALTCLTFIVPPSIQAGEVPGPGAAFPAWQLEDQFGEEHDLPGQASWVVFSASKAADETLSPVLADFVPHLRAGEFVYLSDISRMPGLVTILFALPVLKGRDYPVVLIRDAGVADALPATPGCYTLFDLRDGGVIQEMRTVCEKEALRRVLTESTVVR